jgi:hypothetical protein
MLQRIQSIYLLFAALVIAALFVFPLVHDVYVDGQSVTVKVMGIYTDVNGQQLEAFNHLTIATIVVALMPLAIIFMYRDRKRQIMLRRNGYNIGLQLLGVNHCKKCYWRC